MKRILLTTFCLLLASAILVAQSNGPVQGKSGVKINGRSSCPQDPLLVPDGATPGIYDVVGAGLTNYYWEGFQGGHSYVAEAADPYDTYNSFSPVLKLLSGCSPGPSYTDIATVDPDLSQSFSDRISWIQPSSGHNQVALQNPDGSNAYSYYLRITDTTLHNPRWSTYSGFVTQFSFVNTTGSDLSGVLTLTDINGTKYTANVTVPHNGQIFEVVPGSPGLNVPANHAGFAEFAYIGPVGGITADAYFINPSGTVVVPSKFEPRNYQH